MAALRVTLATIFSGANLRGTMLGHETSIDERTQAEVSADTSAEFRTADVEEASEALARVYVQAQLVRMGTTTLNMQMNARQLPLLTAGYLHFGADVAIRADEVSSYYIDTPLSGSAANRWRDGRVVRTAVGSAAVFSPGMPCELRWSSDCGQTCLKVSEPQMRRQLEAMLSRPVRKTVIFQRELTLDSTAAVDWYALVKLLGREAGRSDGVLGHRLALENLQDLLIQGLLLIQPHNYSEALAENERAASTTVVKRAIDLMHADPQTAWTTVNLARAIGASARSLQNAFRRSGQPPPMVYLRRLRLEHVRAELVASCPASSTVTAVAARWGFLHQGRFADQYRRLFGESPSETLRAEGQH